MIKIILCLLLLSTLSLPALADDSADIIYTNGTILTLANRNSTQQAVAIKGERILAVGSEETIRKLAGAATQTRDLHGMIMVPGFYAAHDHFPGEGRIGTFAVDLNSPPIGKIQSIDDLIAAIKAKAQITPKGKWITGIGYDDTLLKEGRHPTRDDLDKASTDHPIWIFHISGHLGVANSLALQHAHITRDTPQPAAGRIRKDPKTGEPNGVFEEATGLITRGIPPLSQEDQLKVTEKAVADYAAKGVTTTVIAAGSPASIGNLKRALANGILKIRVITMTTGNPAKEARQQIKDLNSTMLTTGAIKMFADGSIQGFTGYLTRPYCSPFEGDPLYCGYPTHGRAELVRRVVELNRQGYQIAIHANGDAAIDDVLAAYTAAQKDTPRPDARDRIEHCQTVREDQLDLIKSLGVTPSFFIAHVYYWGDRHSSLFLGPERAAHISPLQSSIKRDIRFTLHNDTPVTPVDPLMLVWTAVTRLTRSGKVLGPDQCITPEQALRAITSEAAWQNFQEKDKGSIEPGKFADFVVLEKNPLTADPLTIKDIRIVQTIVGGQVIYDHPRGN
jgi:predicted amidohydrolase YtcJ